MPTSRIGTITQRVPGFALVVLAAVLALTGCSGAGPIVHEGLTAVQAKADLKAIEDELAGYLPAGGVELSGDPEWLEPVRIYQCGSDAFLYSNSMSFEVPQGFDATPVLQAVDDEWSTRAEWHVVRDKNEDVDPGVLMENQDGTYVTFRVTANRVHITGFSKCFAGEEYELDDKY